MMKRILPLITGALIALGVLLGALSPASASVPTEGYSCTIEGLQGGGIKADDIHVYRNDKSLAGVVYFGEYVATNHLGQHTKELSLENEPGMNIHVRVDSGSSVVDYHIATDTNGPSTSPTWHFYYPVRKFRLTLNGWTTGWLAPPLTSITLGLRSCPK